MLFLRGDYFEECMQQERISHQEILAAIRAAGLHNLDQVEAVVLETDAQLSVLPKLQNRDTERAETLANVKGFPDYYSMAEVSPEFSGLPIRGRDLPSPSPLEE